VTISTMDGIVAALPGRIASASKTVGYGVAQTRWQSHWLLSGFPGNGVAPSSGVAGDVPTKDTAGRVFPFDNPAGGVFTYLTNLDAVATIQGQVALYDRLWHNSGLSPTLLTAQTVNSVALTRPDALGKWAELWFEVYATMGAGSSNPTVSYTDQDGNAGQSVPSSGLFNFAASAAPGSTFTFALASGDTGVRSVQTYTNTGSLTSGTFGLVIRRRIVGVYLFVGGNVGEADDALTLGMPRIDNDACLEIMSTGFTAATGSSYLRAQLVQG
jgi:hypothetical protein